MPAGTVPLLLGSGAAIPRKDGKGFLQHPTGRGPGVAANHSGKLPFAKRTQSAAVAAAVKGWKPGARLCH